MTEVAAAIARLNNSEPPSGPVIVPASTFPFSAQIKKQEAEAAAAAIVENVKPGDQMPDGTFYLGRFTSKDGTVKDWFSAAEDIQDNSGQRAALDFNQAAAYAKKSKAHDYNDWVLPPAHYDANGEPDILETIFNSKAKIPGFSQGGFFPSTLYWSSSFNTIQNPYAKAQNFCDGEQTYILKKDSLYVRLVRSVTV